MGHAIQNRAEAPPPEPSPRPTLTPVASQYDVSVLGLGGAGLRTATALARRGLSVAGSDPDPRTVARINETERPDAGSEAGTLRAFGGPARARTHVVCTPPRFHEGEPDIGELESAARAVAAVLEQDNLVIVESPLPPGSTRAIFGTACASAGFEPGRDVFVAHAPAQGSRPLHGPRLVGGLTEQCTRRAARFVAASGGGPVEHTRAEHAELAALAHAASQHVNAAFANELANVCDHVGADIWEVRRLANIDPTCAIPRPSAGVTDEVAMRLLVAAAAHEATVLEAARAVNDGRAIRIAARVRAAARRFHAPRIAVFGVASEPDTADCGGSPALHVAQILAREQVGELVVVEPHCHDSPIPGCPLAPAHEALQWADIALILVAHSAFRQLTPEAFARPSVLDVVGLLDT